MSINTAIVGNAAIQGTAREIPDDGLWWGRGGVEGCCCSIIVFRGGPLGFLEEARVLRVGPENVSGTNQGQTFFIQEPS